MTHQEIEFKLGMLFGFSEEKMDEMCPVGVWINCQEQFGLPAYYKRTIDVQVLVVQEGSEFSCMCSNASDIDCKKFGSRADAIAYCDNWIGGVQ